MHVKVKNQGYVRSADIEFIAGLNVIRGKSSQGKSTVVRAIESTVFNTPSDHLVTFGENESSVEIEYRGHSIRRDRNLKSKESKNVYYVDGEQFAKSGRNSLEAVQNTTGIKEVEVSGEKFHLAFSSAFGKPFLVEESPQKIFDFLTFSSSATSLSSVVQTIKADLSSAMEKKKEAEIEEASTKRILDEMKCRTEKFNGIEEIYEKALILEKQEKTKSDIESVSDEIIRIQSLIDSTSKINLAPFPEPILNEVVTYTRLVDVMKRLENAIDSISTLEKNVDELQNLMRLFPESTIKEKIESSLRSIEKIESTIDSLTKTTDLGKGLSFALSLDFPFIDEKDGSTIERFLSVSELVGKIGKTVTDAKELRLSEQIEECTKEIFGIGEQLKSFSVCPLCGSHIGNC